MTWTLRLVGTPGERRGGDLLPLPFERRSQLVALLALRGDWMRRSEIAALLWPDLPRALASTNLRKALFRLRDATWSGGLEADGELLRLVTATDVDDFTAKVQQGNLAEALSAHSGELLEGFDDDTNEPWSDWLRNERDRWRSAWRSAALQRLAEPVASEEGLALAAAMLRADPLDEAALQAQMRHLAGAGQVAGAREAYRAFAQRLQQELGVEPGSALRATHDGLQAHPLPTAALPAVDDGFVGRVLEQRRILELMQRPDCRLLAIVGPGGVGKTRLVRRVLEEVAQLFADGAVFVGLEDVDTPDAFVARLGRDLGVARLPKRDEFELIAGHLEGRQALLVLDNFEPVAQAVTPMLGRLLERAPRLKVIVTSRERLALGAQWALPIDGLPVPEPEDMDRLDDFDAPRLFIAAARRADPAIDPNGERAAIVDICRQVDGLPLALELAAAWTRVMRCADIARELRQGTDFLRATNASFPARQASVETVLDQSWRLLGGREREALAKLSVFRGGFTVDAARSVAAAPLPVLGALTDKSLLRKEGGRMTLHPLVQQFAALKLGDGEEHVAARSAHAGWFQRLLIRHQAPLRAGDAAALRLIDDDYENCHLALQWLSAHGPASSLLVATRTLVDHSRHRGLARQGVAMMEAALAAPVASRDPVVRARLLAHAANHHFRLDQYAEAEATAREALALAATDDDDARETARHAHYALGSLALERGRLDDARTSYTAMLNALGDAASTQDRAVAVENLALVERRLGHLDEALRLAHESVALRRRPAGAGALAVGLNNLASLHMHRGELDAAEPLLNEARALCEHGGFSYTLPIVFVNLCEVAMARGDLAAAATFGEKAAALAESSGQRNVMGTANAKLGTVALRRGDTAAAREPIARACGVALTLEGGGPKAVAILAFARLLHRDGHARAARQVLNVAIAEPSLSATDRADLDEQITAWHAEPLAAPPGLTLDALLHHAVVEANTGYAGLLELLDA